MEEVKLLGVYGSPFSRRVETALKWKGIQYEFIEEDLTNKSPLLLKCNPIHKKVPVLIHNGKPIVESLVIIEYIDEIWVEHPILPKDPYARALARFWAKFLDDKCIPALWKALHSKGEEGEKAKEEALGSLAILENELKDKKFFGGDNIGLPDITANFLSLWLMVTQEVLGIELLTKQKFPKLSQWVDDYLHCPVIQESMPEREILTAYFKGRAQVASAAT